LSLAIQFGARSGESPVDRSQLRRWAAAALGQDAALTLRFVGSAEGRTLNHEFRGRDYATNVLTFEYPMMGEGPLEADIVICLPVLAKEARAQGKSLRDHLAHLVVHGTLHAQGMDHENDADAQAMESREVEILRRFRIADPYR
jgi:probable rRNA maturation factor